MMRSFQLHNGECIIILLLSTLFLPTTAFVSTSSTTKYSSRSLPPKFHRNHDPSQSQQHHIRHNYSSSYTSSRSYIKSQLSMSIPNPFDTFTSGLASISRLPYGVTVSSPSNTANYKDTISNNNKKKNDKNIRILALYDIERSRQCQLVRERITELDLVVEKLIPTASNSRVFTDPNYEYSLRNGALEKSIPRMIVKISSSRGTTDDATFNMDDDDDQEMTFVGAEDILNFLNEYYDNDSPADSSEDNSMEEDDNFNLSNIKTNLQDLFNHARTFVPSILRYGRGDKVSSCALSNDTPRPSKPLVLYSYEGNQFCRLVREVLTELDIVYELRSTGKLSPRRQELAGITGGSTQCPFLIDPNTGVQMAESKDIIQYLYKNYANWTPPNELLRTISNVVTPILAPIYKKLAPLQAGSYEEDQQEFRKRIADAKSTIEEDIKSNDVVIYTYSLSPFCTEATTLLDNLNIPYKEISLGFEWLPGLIRKDGGSETRAALGEMTGQTSLPHIFVGGKSIGGLFSGNPGLVPSLENGEFKNMVKDAQSARSTVKSSVNSSPTMDTSSDRELGVFE